ncbi:hypothetical protein [Filomicrobium sp.]|uniref:hypothetical protein n=1 Tax=Filomicrobium sp. TaxID=2024831 RepID=UPI00258893C2|nr:hypothetical protein [Filomicrobium sp.]MCV0371923.1 hypothetical protein [Filomicrobium sp.]
MRDDAWRFTEAAGEADRLVRKQSEGRDWSNLSDVMEISMRLGELREYFATSLLEAPGALEKHGVRHYAERSFTRMIVCDMALKREEQLHRAAVQYLLDMGRALARNDADSFVAARHCAENARRCGLDRFPEGVLHELVAVADDLLVQEGRDDAAMEALAGRTERAMRLWLRHM